jgi:predicted transcriptional regulator
MWPSDISFYINDVPIGMWTSPGDFGKQRGVLTLGWWNHGTQHGLPKIISVTPNGAYLDGMKHSNITNDDLGVSFGKDFSFKIACEEDAKTAAE